MIEKSADLNKNRRKFKIDRIEMGGLVLIFYGCIGVCHAMAIAFRTRNFYNHRNQPFTNSQITGNGTSQIKSSKINL